MNIVKRKQFQFSVERMKKMFYNLFELTSTIIKESKIKLDAVEELNVAFYAIV